MTTKQFVPQQIAENEELKAGITQIVSLLLDEDTDVRARVSTNLIVVALPEVRNFVLSDLIDRALSRKAKVRESAIRALKAVRLFAVERLKGELFFAQDRKKRRQLVMLLGKVSVRYDVLVIMVLGDIAHNKHDHPSVRKAAREVLQRIFPERGQDEVREQELAGSGMNGARFGRGDPGTVLGGAHRRRPSRVDRDRGEGETGWSRSGRNADRPGGDRSGDQTIPGGRRLRASKPRFSRVAVRVSPGRIPEVLFREIGAGITCRTHCRIRRNSCAFFR